MQPRFGRVWGIGSHKIHSIHGLHLRGLNAEVPLSAVGLGRRVSSSAIYRLYFHIFSVDSESTNLPPSSHLVKSVAGILGLCGRAKCYLVLVCGRFSGLLTAPICVNKACLRRTLVPCALCSLRGEFLVAPTPPRARFQPSPPQPAPPTYPFLFYPTKPRQECTW